MEFLAEGGSVLDVATLDLATIQMPDTTWRQGEVSGTAPAGTANVRVTAGATGMFANVGPTQSAFFDELVLELETPPGDFDGDADVDGNDVLLIQRGLGTTRTAADFDAFKINFGTGGSTASISAVSEPATSAAMALAALCLTAGPLRSRRR